MAMMLALNLAGVLRVSEEGELEGLDLHEHGIPAYPEYTLHPAASPQGTAGFNSTVLSAHPAHAPGTIHAMKAAAES